VRDITRSQHSLKKIKIQQRPLLIFARDVTRTYASHVTYALHVSAREYIDSDFAATFFWIPPLQISF
jgi:hypothetical protein